LKAGKLWVFLGIALVGSSHEQRNYDSWFGVFARFWERSVARFEGAAIERDGW